MMYDDTLKIGINYVDKKNLEFFLDVLDEREINYIMLNYLMSNIRSSTHNCTLTWNTYWERWNKP